MRRALFLLLLLLGTPLRAQQPELRLEHSLERQPEQAPQAPEPAPYPTVREIAFEGNDTTRPRTMLREMVIAVGDPADPEKVERSRQAVQDLGLFKTVSVREEPLPGGGVRLVYKVRERWYILPVPRVDAKVGGEYSYGAQLTWNNLWGLDHTLRVIWEREDNKEAGVGLETNHSFSYAAPQVFDSRYGVNVSAGEVQRPIELAGGGAYEETLTDVGFSVSRSLGDGPPSQGWIVSGGVTWLNQDTSGMGAAEPYGMATAPFVGLTYRDLHLKIYSEEGQVFRSSVRGAFSGLASDYGFTTIGARYGRYIHVGDTAHQSLHLFADLGARVDGPPENDGFGIGGDSFLRGYDKDFVEGDAVYRVAAEFARPVFRRWLRWAVIAEAGNAFTEPDDFTLSRIYASLGLALRVRMSMFVNLELELGVAMPIGDNGGVRVFGGRVQ